MTLTHADTLVHAELVQLGRVLARHEWTLCDHQLERCRKADTLAFPSASRLSAAERTYVEGGYREELQTLFSQAWLAARVSDG